MYGIVQKSSWIGFVSGFNSSHMTSGPIYPTCPVMDANILDEA